MKKYRINLNGKAYEVEVEEITGSESQTETKSAPKKVEKIKSIPSKKTSTQGEDVKAPMPGTIVSVKVNEGDNVKAGDVLLVLEAMKMENEIVAPIDGKIISINTSKGASVAGGDVLITIG
ncbi:biotin/lipoyl-containing protein [Tepidibacter aestuarii]|uniref:biotin/lipoyl-containing protein n=1 Tax=Tepidibacter aestuarii TaxID=2925782 RepID=UPI0020BE7B39|nr:biotin/lipoyl-containing protein [Tepidibacter aestuarii]CAH2214519.1 glutaconyl-CoA/methylmalonyl-CoA decarboxylase subunit gamma [Tepidibacter aestuarii]